MKKIAVCIKLITFTRCARNAIDAFDANSYITTSIDIEENIIKLSKKLSSTERKYLFDSDKKNYIFSPQY